MRDSGVSLDLAYCGGQCVGPCGCLDTVSDCPATVPCEGDPCHPWGLYCAYGCDEEEGTYLAAWCERATGRWVTGWTICDYWGDPDAG
jgi:hypothetical protein